MRIEIEPRTHNSLRDRMRHAPRPAYLPLVFLMSAATHADTSLNGIAIDRNIVYASADGKDLKLDIYWHKALEGPVPLIVWIHGGAWRQGSKENPRVLPMLSEGYAVASIQYRLSQEAIFPAQIHDCKAAIRWLRANALRYGYDPDRIGAWGASAGGHLVALLGTSGDVTELEGTLGVSGVSSRVQAVADWFGPTDFLRMNDVAGTIDHDAPDSPESRLVGAPIQENADRVERANPITYITEDDPPFLIMHGAADLTVLKNQSEFLHTSLQQTGVSTNLILIDNQGHGFRGADGHKEDLVRHVLSFFDRELKQKRSDWVKHANNPYPWVTDFGPNDVGTHDVIFQSSTIDDYYSYTVYLPPSYNSRDQNEYPTVYWLHGRRGRPHGATHFISRAHNAMLSGHCPEFVIVAPTGLQSSMYVDSRDGSFPVETVILDDLIPHIEATYPVSTDRKMRAIDGFSMGGFGSAHIGFKHPDVFGTISLMGAALHRPEFLRDERSDIFSRAFGNDLTYCEQESPWALVRQNADRLRNRTAIRLFVGESDHRLREKNIEFSTLLNELDLSHDHGVISGAGHNEAQLMDGIGDAVWSFYKRAFPVE